MTTSFWSSSTDWEGAFLATYLKAAADLASVEASGASALKRIEERVNYQLAELARNFQRATSPIIPGDSYPDNQGESYPIQLNQRIESTLETSRDNDWFAIFLVEGSKYRIGFTGSTETGGKFGLTLAGSWAYLDIYDNNGRNADGTGSLLFTDGSLYNVPRVFLPSSTGIYLLKVAVYYPGYSGKYSLVLSDDASPAPTSTYSLKTSATAGVIDEGSTLTTTVTTTGVSSGTILYYALDGGAGINRADFSSGELTGQVSISPSGSAIFSHVLASDLTTEGDEVFEIRLFLNAARTILAGTYLNVIIRDTSTQDSASIGNNKPSNLATTSTIFNENITAGSTVATLSTTDPDSGDTFSYSLVSGTGSPLTIGAVTLGTNQLGYAIKNGAASPIQVSFSGQLASSSNPGAGWSAFAAAALGTGYELFWKNSVTGQYVRWLLDANGILSSGAILSTSELLLAETSLGTDLNADGFAGNKADSVIAKPSIINDYITTTGEVDRFPIDSVTGAIISASLTSTNPSLFPLIDLKAPDGTLLKSSIAYNGNFADLGMFDLATGKAVLEVRTQVGATGDYSLEFAIATREEIKTEVIRLTNLERQKGGLNPLTRNVLLEQAAEGHVRDMDASDKYLAHTGSNGSTPQDRIKATGYKAGWVDLGNGSLRTISSENAASGQTSAAAVVDAWMNSPGHRAAIMDAATKEIGVGFEYDDQTGTTYWIQNFGYPWTQGMTVWF